MKFQYTKHKELWNRIIKKIESINVSNDGFNPFGLLHTDCLTDMHTYHYSYACDYAKKVRTNQFASICRYCPVKSCIVPDSGYASFYRDLVDAYSSGDMVNAANYARLIRDIPVNEGVEYE